LTQHLSTRDAGDEALTFYAPQVKKSSFVSTFLPGLHGEPGGPVIPNHLVHQSWGPLILEVSKNIGEVDGYLYSGEPLMNHSTGLANHPSF